MEIIAIAIEIIAKMLAAIDCEFFGIITAIRLFTLLPFIRQRDPLKVSIELCLFAKLNANIIKFLPIQIFYNKYFTNTLKNTYKCVLILISSYNAINNMYRPHSTPRFFIRTSTR